MKSRFLLSIAALACCVLLTPAIKAQYTQKWSTTTDGQHILDLANTDGDAALEILVGDPSTAGYSAIFLYDGQSGQLEWSFFAQANQRVEGGEDRPDPVLKDVDGDGVAEIVFWVGDNFSPHTNATLRCYDSDVTVGVEDDAENPVLPQNLELGQNYPNPFNPETVISYSVPSQCHVTLTVFNLLGQRVATLVNEEKAAGDYEITWDAIGQDGSRLASGVYFYALQTNDERESRKMMLVK